ncbi:hypothetical protein [Kitasatospora griseola]|uniref:hypothetical protein n=1 Tax=Kitasatospora griseola TaxID=2064 RepID=UPI0037FF883E
MPSPRQVSLIVRSSPRESGTGTADLWTQSRPTCIDYAVAVHENTRQWFGDSVSFTGRRGGRIAECVAQYADQLWEEHKAWPLRSLVGAAASAP